MSTITIISISSTCHLQKVVDFTFPQVVACYETWSGESAPIIGTVVLPTVLHRRENVVSNPLTVYQTPAQDEVALL